MPGIDTYLQQILNGRYGRDVRQAIHDALDKTYDDATASGNANAEVAAARGTFDTLKDRLSSMITSINTARSMASTNSTSINALGGRVTALEGIGAWGNTIFNSYTEAIEWAQCTYTESISKGAVLMFYIHDRSGGLYHAAVLPYYNDNITCVQYVTNTKYLSVEFFDGTYCNVRLFGFPGGAAVFRIVRILS